MDGGGPRQPAGDARAALVRRLLEGVRMAAGLEPTRAAADKLLRHFRTTPPAALTGTVAVLETLPRHHPDWLDLVAVLTVHETSFFRDPRQFDMFRSQVLPPLIAREAAAGTCRLRICSAGCATGEEAYSIAMLVADALIAAGEARATPGRLACARPWDIVISGADIAPAVLAHARRGVYPTGAASRLDRLPPQFHCYLPAIDAAHCQVRADLRAMVRFEPCNLALGLLPAGPFDAVFCRNVLIYLTPAARAAAQAALRNAVRPGGALMLGSTDTLQAAPEFRAVWGQDAVIYRRDAAPGGAG